MQSRQLVDFVEAGIAAYGITKVVPDDDVLESHARHHLESKFSSELLARHAAAIAERAAATKLPPDLLVRVVEVLSVDPALSWDQALARLV